MAPLRGIKPSHSAQDAFPLNAKTMKLEDHFSRTEIEKLENLPRKLRRITWICVPLMAFFLGLFVWLYASAVALGREHGIHGIFTIFSYWDKVSYPSAWNSFYEGYEVMIGERVARAFLPFGIAIFILTIFISSIYGIKNYMKLWSLAKRKSNGEEIILREHLSKQALVMMKRTTSKKYWWFSLGMVLFLPAFSILMAVLHYNRAMHIGEMFGIYGLNEILGFWYKDIDVCRTYLGYELMIGNRISTAIIGLASAMAVIIMGFIFLFQQRRSQYLQKCFTLMNPDA